MRFYKIVSGGRFCLNAESQKPASVISYIEVIPLNRQKIVHSMELSALAYKDVQPGCCYTLIDSPESDVQCFLRKREDTLYITFRGSNSAKDWKNNLTFWKKTIPYDNTESKIRVHSGFINAYKAPDVRYAILSALKPGIRCIRISGHSQGAALALLCAVDIEYNFPHLDIEAVVFGCPRIGNHAFKSSYNKRVVKTVRVENGNDIVTKVPFALWGYRHVGAKLRVGSPRIPLCFSLLDHYPYKYYSALLTEHMP